jgi:glycine betaine/proline transport system ATP-binding protein
VRTNKSLGDIVITDVPRVSPQTLLADLFELCGTAKLPVAVVNDSNRLVGVIVRGAVLGALAGQITRTEVSANVTEVTS